MLVAQNGCQFSVIALRTVEMNFNCAAAAAGSWFEDAAHVADVDAK
jgi:hypothetical protein